MIPFNALWSQYLRIIKDNGAICLTACQPFTTRLINSKTNLFRYCWYWSKNMATGFVNAKKQPLRCIEEICVFYKHPPMYHPQGTVKLDTPIYRKGSQKTDSVYRDLSKGMYSYITHYPRQLIQFNCQRGLHPTQKPVELFEYFIQTYTNPGDLVLDNCLGSGTTKIACMRTGRHYTGFEKDPVYFDIAMNRKP